MDRRSVVAPPINEFCRPSNGAQHQAYRCGRTRANRRWRQHKGRGVDLRTSVEGCRRGQEVLMVDKATPARGDQVLLMESGRTQVLFGTVVPGVGWKEFTGRRLRQFPGAPRRRIYASMRGR